MSSTVQNVQRAESGREATQCREAVLRTSWRLERGGKYLVWNGVGLSLEELFGAIKSNETRLSVTKSYGWMLAELLRRMVLKSFPKYIRDCLLVDIVHDCGGDPWVMFLKSKFIIGGCCPTLK